MSPYLHEGQEVIRAEIDALRATADLLGPAFEEAVKMVLSCQGRVVVSGMGKAGLIGQKISATLSSTGTPSLFLHPAEALHGDLGRVVKNDVVLLLSNSGETEETVRLLPFLKKVGTPIIAFTSQADSTLGREAEVRLLISTSPEACPLGLAPTASTTALLALGDALAVTVSRHRNFSKEDFALYHPAGALGKKILRVADVMRKTDDTPILPESATVAEAVRFVTSFSRLRAGAVLVVGGEGKLAGIFTDGDLKRLVARGASRLEAPLGEVMTRNCKRIRQDRYASEAFRLLKENRIDDLPVVDADDRPVGLVAVQDLLETGMV